MNEMIEYIVGLMATTYLKWVGVMRPALKGLSSYYHLWGPFDISVILKTQTHDYTKCHIHLIYNLLYICRQFISLRLIHELIVN